MKYNTILHKHRHKLVIGTTVALVLICVFGLWIAVYQKNTNGNQKDPSNPAKNSTTEPTKVVTDSKPDEPLTSKQTREPAPPTKACVNFTKQIAQQILGQDATINLNESITTDETADVEVSSCVYTSSGAQKTIRLVAHLAKTPLGQSTNAIVFGSDRPSSAQNIPSYGQAAFWDDSIGVLHVLKNNNHYEIILAANVPLREVELAANILVPKL
jgi:hypothetical protein